MNVNIDIDRILEAGAKAVDTAKKTATDLAREGKRQTDLLALQGKKAKAERQLGALVYSLAKNGEQNQPLVEKYIAALAALDEKIAELKAQKAADEPKGPAGRCFSPAGPDSARKSGTGGCPPRFLRMKSSF